MTIALNPALDMGGIAQAFRREGRVHIPGILTSESAARVHRCLEQETDFLVFARGGDAQGLASAAALTPQQQGAVMAEAYSRARDQFHFLYDVHPMSNEGEPYPDSSHYLSNITAFLNSAPVLDFVITVCEPQESCPSWPGQPINAHWSMPDPATAGADEMDYAFAETYRALHGRLSIFINLNMAGLSRLSLQKQINDIGGPA